MENKENSGKRARKKVISFRKKRLPDHFSSADMRIKSDVDGSYTGIPVDTEDPHPVQDADDL